MLVGYGRTSTLEQMADLDAQVRDLTEVGDVIAFTLGQTPQRSQTRHRISCLRTFLSLSGLVHSMKMKGLAARV